MPYRPHSEYPSPYASTPQVKKRPSGAWFGVGAVLLLVAGVVFGITIFRFVRDIAHADAVFQASGVHQVTVPPGTERAVFVSQGQRVARCTAQSSQGLPVLFRRPSEQFTYGDWVAVRVFDSGDGRITFTCPTRGVGEIRIGEIPSENDFARVGFLGILLPMGLGGIGFVILLVTTILWISRRPTAPPPGPPPGWQSGPPPGWQPGPPPGGPPPAGPPTWPPTP